MRTHRATAACAALAALTAVTPCAAQVTPGCTLSDVDVPFEAPLTLLHALPEPGAMVEHPFVEVLRASRVTAALHPGAAPDLAAQVEVETSALRLRGVARAERFAWFPSRAAVFGVVVPLARHALSLRGVAAGSLRLTPRPTGRVRFSERPEWRPCDAVQMRPPADFDRAAVGATPEARRVPTPRGTWTFTVTPDNRDGPRAQVTASQGDVVWELARGPGAWRRWLWFADDLAVIGWTTPPHVVSLGVGRGTGHGAPIALPAPRALVTCPRELTLFAADGDSAREVGAVRVGAMVSPGEVVGAHTRVTVVDREVRWDDAAAPRVPTAQLAACSPR